jgi:hypothetical protein
MMAFLFEDSRVFSSGLSSRVFSGGSISGGTGLVIRDLEQRLWQVGAIAQEKFSI